MVCFALSSFVFEWLAKMTLINLSFLNATYYLSKLKIFLENLQLSH